MITFEPVRMDEACWREMEEIGEANIFQTPRWLQFVADTRKAEPVVAVVWTDDHVAGYFTGLIVHKYGLKILGSPFRGWGSYFMGFNLLAGISRRDVLLAFPRFAFEQLRCHIFEIVDPSLSSHNLEGLPYENVEILPWYALDLTKTEEQLFAEMKSAGRNCIRKSIKEGVTIEEAVDPDFADEYYAQHIEVMKKHGLLPTYDIAYLRRMIHDLLPTGNMLLLRARDPGGHCIATGIFLSLNKTAVFWGAASLREYQSLRPNEPLAWYGIKSMKARGLKEFHFGGECDQYKEKFGCYPISLLRLQMARNALLEYPLRLATSPKSSRYRNWMLRRL